MAFEHGFEVTATQIGETKATQVVVSGNGRIEKDASVPGTTTDHAVDADWADTDLASLYFLSDQDVTLDFVDASTHNKNASIALKANKLFFWESSTGYFADPIGHDVESIKVTNAGDTAATVQIRVLTS